MRTKQWIVLAVVLTALVLLMILVVRADPPAQGPEHQGAVTGQAGVGTAFTYQGQLESGGEPVNDDCDMAFRLYDEESGGSQVGSAISTTVPVADGLFTVGLDFGGVFTGDARWLAMAVRCPAGSGAYEALSPRQPLSPVPYAMHATTVKQLVHDFVVASGESISAGDVVAFLDGQVYGPSDEWGTESVFNEATTGSIAVSALSGTDFVVAYRDEGNSSYGTAVVGTVSGGIVSWGAESVFNEANTGYIAVSALSATEVVVAYRDEGNSSYGTAVVGTVGGGTVSWGTASVFNEAGTTEIAVSALSGTDFVVAYAVSGDGTARVGTVSGGTVSWGTESVFNAAPTDLIAVSTLSATEVVVAYQDGGPTSPGTARVGTVSGGTVSWGTESVFNATDTWSIAVSALSATEVVVAYRDEGNSGYGTAIVGKVSGANVSWGTASVFNEAGTGYIAASSLSPADFVVAYKNWGSGHGTARVGTVSGETVSWGAESVFNEASTDWIAVSALSAAEVVVAYQDVGNSGYGTARVGNTRRRLTGTAKTAAGGETVTVILGGVSDVHSGLVPGEMYYLQPDGSLGLALTAHRVGLAISETELILDQVR